MTLVLGHNNAYKSELCSTFEVEKFCPDGSTCSRAHGLRELRSFENPLFKTQMCTAYEQEARCRMGESCLFAHGEEELRDLTFPTPPQSSLTATAERIANIENQPSGSRVINRQNIDVQLTQRTNSKNQTKFCKYFANYGECNKGEACIFPHLTKNDVESSSAASASDSFPSLLQQPQAIPTVQLMTNADQSGMLKPVDPRKIKTRLCAIYLRNQNCPNKGSCNYAHGESELRVPSTPNENTNKGTGNFKTVLCKNFEEKECFSGDNCVFAHSRFELRPRGFKGDFDEKIKQNPNWKFPCVTSFNVKAPARGMIAILRMERPSWDAPRDPRNRTRTHRRTKLVYAKSFQPKATAGLGGCVDLLTEKMNFEEVRRRQVQAVVSNNNRCSYKPWHLSH